MNRKYPDRVHKTGIIYQEWIESIDYSMGQSENENWTEGKYKNWGHGNY